MKKTLIIIVIILAVILALPVVNLIRWTFQPKKPMDIILVDKTVPTLERENHKSFSWILTNSRFVEKEKKTAYSYKKDYFGFFPQRPIRDHQWERNDYRLGDILVMAEKYDAIYVADTYGVFFNDWYRGMNKSRKSRKLYGGLNNNDFLLIKEMKDRNKLVIMEYNTFDYPTAQYESYRAQERLGITSTGWTGKYFATLDSTAIDFPIWMTGMYRKEYSKPWNFTKPGIVILTQKNIIVLEEGTHLKTSLPFIVTDKAECEKYGVIDSVAFDNWFDIIDPKQCSVISNFRLETTTLGDTVLAERGLTNIFPAAVKAADTPAMYYLSGNFAWSDKPFWTSRFMGMDKLKGVLWSDKPDDTRRFFWFYYRPLINTIFTDYYATSNKVTAIDK